jgi:hypothetical protein
VSMLRPAVAIALVLIVAGCGTGESASPGGGTPTATTADCKPLLGSHMWKSEPAVPPSLLTSVMVDALPCSDRVVFGFRESPGEPPGFIAVYEPGSSAKTEDGSGRRIAVDGSAFLVLRFLNAATADVDGEDVTPTYTGPRRIPAEGTRFVREIVKTGDFEYTLTWVIGLDEERPFTANVSDSRVVVDIG